MNDSGIQVVVAADDMGRKSSVNRAIAECHQNGILTAASVMAGGEDFGGAVALAYKFSGLSVGIHITLCDGRAVLPGHRIPALADTNGLFEKSPFKAGLRYMRNDARPQIEAEVKAQFDRLENAGIRPTHVDGHHHLHMHPRIFGIVCREACRRGIGWIRIPGEPLGAVLRLHSRSRLPLSLLEWAAFGLLGIANARKAAACGIHSLPATYGLSRSGDIDEASMLRIIDALSGPAAEIFTHPDTGSESGIREVNALTSIAVRRKLLSRKMITAGFRELIPLSAAYRSAWGRT